MYVYEPFTTLMLCRLHRHRRVDWCI